MTYRTVAGHGVAEVAIKRSSFLASVAPAKNEADAWAFVEKIRGEHREASHNCFAFKAGGSVRMSDDGEPSGTAGRPILDVIEKQGLLDVVVVVTRYFGGILLGAGGLVRAYSQAASAGLAAAGVAQGLLATDLLLRLEYPLVGKVQHVLERRGAVTLDSQFGQQVAIRCRLPSDRVEELEAELAEVSAGRILVERLSEQQVGSDLKPL